jgi:Circularly permutated YpsA SLOG family
MIPAHYPVQAVPSGGYRERTIQNVIDSDATLILYFGRLQGGTEQTLVQCVIRSKPYKLIDGAEIPPHRAAQLAVLFVDENNVSTLNVAGPRSSQARIGHQYAYEVARELLRLQCAGSGGGA